jgi:glycosyltransferase involved in cell wall biosynthesis
VSDFTCDVTAVIPTHPARVRSGMLECALQSVLRQTVQPREIIVVNDTERRGSAMTRNRALQKATTKWVAFLDSDDEWLPTHLEVLVTTVAALEVADTPADVIYTGCRVVGPTGLELPLQEEWGRFGMPFDADLLRRKSYIPVTSLVRTRLATEAWFEPPSGSPYDDWGFYLRLLDRGAMFHHVPEVTWTWHHHGANTSGQPGRGDAE